jgi:hypothetical protein
MRRTFRDLADARKELLEIQQEFVRLETRINAVRGFPRIMVKAASNVDKAREKPERRDANKLLTCEASH